MEDSIHVKNKNRTRLCKVLSKKNLKQKFNNPGIKQDKTKDQSSQCHLRLGHTKQHCDCGPREGPQICGDLDKHKNEKKEPNESTQNVKAINRELEKNSNEVYQQKIKFKKKIVLHLSVKFCLTL